MKPRKKKPKRRAPVPVPYVLRDAIHTSFDRLMPGMPSGGQTIGPLRRVHVQPQTYR